MKTVKEHAPGLRENNGIQRHLACLNNWAERHLLVLAALILILSGLPFISVIDDPPHADVHIYQAAAIQILDGALPYENFLLEYPPYVIPLFLLPAMCGEENYGICFKLFALLGDAAIKCLLLAIGLREAKGSRSLLPLALYCIAVPFIKYFFLQRYDIFPALVSLTALWLFSSRKYALAGLMIAVGAGMKVYPALFAPPLLALAWRERHAREFALGTVAGLAPLGLLSFLLPWWNFLAFHTERGLQAESLHASTIWLLHHFGIGDGMWEGGRRCVEVHGIVADKTLPWARLWFLCAVLTSVAVSCVAAARLQSVSAASPGEREQGDNAGILKGTRISRLARLLLTPLLAFVAFNQVFSPQFMVWVLPLAAVSSLDGRLWIPAAISMATALTAGFFPSPEYGRGLDIIQTLILVVRNFILICAWAVLGQELLKGIRTRNE